ncbi:MAG: hypothetical protein IIC02_10020 [Planctomycetes bacterium]|nr:hypothetical protein [Planctomycetota bacterium]
MMVTQEDVNQRLEVTTDPFDSRPRDVARARTRQVGPYRLEPGLTGRDVFAVNLFSEVESHVRPTSALVLGAATLPAKAALIQVNKPAWPYFLIALLVLLLLEWVIYNHRIFV